MGESNSKFDDCCCGNENTGKIKASINLINSLIKKDHVENKGDNDDLISVVLTDGGDGCIKELIDENYDKNEDEIINNSKINYSNYIENDFKFVDLKINNCDTNTSLDKQIVNICNSGLKNYKTVINENFTSYIKSSNFDCNVLNHSMNENNKTNNNITRKKNNINNENFLKFVIQDFDKNMIKKINEIRKNPQLFINKIEELKKNIIMINNKFYYIKDNIKFLMKKGIEDFNEIIEYLKQINNLNVLELDQNLLIDQPKNFNELNDKNYLKIKINELYEKGMKIKYYWKSNIYIDSQEENLLMNFLTEKNDTKNKLKAIFDEKIKKIGIKSFEIDNKYFYYIILSYG